MKRKKKPSRYQQERQRFRNTQRKILNLEERVQAIQLYDLSPIYMRVATAFKCSWEQIKNVIQNRDAILEYYARCQTVGANDNPRMVRQKKINFLGKVMYEYVRRAHYYQIGVIDNESVREQALMFRNILQIDCFSPNKAWVADFKTAYNLDFTQLDALVYTHKPPSSLNCVDIVLYCNKELEDTQKILQREDGSSSVGATVAATSGSINDVNDVIDVDSRDSLDFKIGNQDQQDEFDDNELIDFGDEDEEDADSVADGDDINDNEEGPTIYYGDDDYNAEAEDSIHSFFARPDSPKEWQIVPKETQNSQKAIQPVAQATQLSPKVSQEPAVQSQVLAQEPQKPALEQQKSINDPETLPKKQEQLQLAPTQRTECIPKIICVPSDTDTTTTPIIDNTLITSFRESLRKNTYAAALEILQPLEEFALLEEDFSAINLLSQLLVTFRNGRKRKMQTLP